MELAVKIFITILAITLLVAMSASFLGHTDIAMMCLYVFIGMIVVALIVMLVMMWLM
jgi:hypothetical protein